MSLRGSAVPGWVQALKSKTDRYVHSWYIKQCGIIASACRRRKTNTDALRWYATAGINVNELATAFAVLMYEDYKHP